MGGFAFLFTTAKRPDFTVFFSVLNKSFVFLCLSAGFVSTCGSSSDRVTQPQPDRLYLYMETPSWAGESTNKQPLASVCVSYLLVCLFLLLYLAPPLLPSLCSLSHCVWSLKLKIKIKISDLRFEERSCWESIQPTYSRIYFHDSLFPNFPNLINSYYKPGTDMKWTTISYCMTDFLLSPLLKKN